MWRVFDKKDQPLTQPEPHLRNLMSDLMWSVIPSDHSEPFTVNIASVTQDEIRVQGKDVYTVRRVR